MADQLPAGEPAQPKNAAERAEGWAHGIGILFLVAVVGVAVFFGFIAYLTTCRGQTRSNPAFQGFKGEWTHEHEAGSLRETWHLSLGQNSWSIWTRTPDGNNIKDIDAGTWTDMGNKTYLLRSKSGTRTAVISKSDEWVMTIDGDKYFRVVK